MKVNQNIKLSRHHLRALVKPIVVMVTTFFILGIIANIVVDNPYAHRILRLAINEKVKQYSNLNLDFKAINVRVLPLELSLYGFNVFVKDKDGEEALLASASQIHARVSFFSLLLGVPKLAVLEMTDLNARTSLVEKIEIYLDDDNSSSDAFTWPPRTYLPIGGLVLRNTALQYVYESEDYPMQFGVEGLDLEADIDHWDDFSASVNIAALNFNLEDREVFTRAKFAAEFIANRNDINIENISLESRLLNVKGFIENKINASRSLISSINTTGDLDFDGDLAMLDKFFDIPDTFGLATGHARLQFVTDMEEGDVEDFLISISGGVQKGQIYEFKLFDSQAEIDIDFDGMYFRNIDVQIEGEKRGTGSGELLFDDKMGFSFLFSPDQLHLSQLLSGLTLDFDEIDAYLNGQDYKISGQGFPFELKTSGLLNLDHVTVDALSYLDPQLSPKCFVNLVIFSNEDYILFDGSQAECFRNPSWPSYADIRQNPGKYDDLSRVDVSGGVNYSGRGSRFVAVNTTGFDLRLSSYFSGLRKSGRADAVVKFVPQKEDLLIDIALQADLVQIEEVPLGRIEGQLNYFQNKINIEKIQSRLDAENFIEIENSVLEMEDDLPFELNLAAAHLPPSMISPLINRFIEEKYRPVLGAEFLNANIQGKFFQPLAYTGRFNGLLSEGYYHEEKIFDNLRFDLASDARQDHLRSFSYQLGNFVVNATGTRTRYKGSSRGRTPEYLHDLGLNYNDEVKLSFGTTNRIIELNADAGANEELAQKNMTHIPFIQEDLKKYEIDGALNISSTIEGKLDEISGTMQVGMNHFSVLGSEIAPVHVQAFLQKKKMDLIIRHSGTALNGRFVVDLEDKKLPYSLYLKATRMDMRSFTPIPFHTDPRNYAYVTASLSLEGYLEDWWNSVGDIKIDDTQMNYTAAFSPDSRRVELRLEEPIAVRIDKEGWNIQDEKKLKLSGSFLNFSLSTGKNRPPQSFDLDFGGSLDLSGLAMLSSRIESSSGKVVFNGELKGRMDDPKFLIKVHNEKSLTNKVSFGLVDLRPSFDDIDFDMTINRSRVVLERLTATKGGGRIRAVGQVDLSSEDSDAQIDVSFQDTRLVFPAPIVKLVETSVSGNLFIKNALPPYEVSGNVMIDRGRTVGDIDPRKEIVDALRQEEYHAATTTLDHLVEFNISINADNSLIINNRNMQATLSADLRVSGTDIQPSVLGQVEINKGKFIYKRDFHLTQGLLTFDDPVRLDPKLDLSATSEVLNYRVFIGVSGRASEPVVDLSTDPATRDDGMAITKLDIITLLSTGALPDINRNEINSQTVAQTEALNIFAGQLEEPVERLFDLSGQKVVREVYIDTYAISGGRPLARLNMPLNLGKNWDMIFRVDQESWRVSSEYSLHENISILGSFDGRSEVEINNSGQTSQGDTGVDVKFRFSFP